ncbi:MAG TPA: hypothetical protein VK466_11490 [Terriglobales bacterium]|nr:hypothetical protein [Terriglobales bacterium]
MSNDWVRLEIVPQLGGRLMQVTFGEHRYLFVNPKYKGKYFSPSAASKGQWFNYGGDKLWPLLEGHGPGQWPGPISDVLDDGEYKASIVSQAEECKVHVEGPGDPATGLQYLRDISIANDSPQISFHARMKNISDHPIRWSMQSVTQYDTADLSNPENYNHSFWAFAPVNPHSAFPDGYLVRAGLADDPSFTVDDGLFKLHWLYLENEVWLDSDVGWMAVVDDASRYAMIERFHYRADSEYPGKASVIFYKNGAALTLDQHGMSALRSDHPREAPFYMEAEVNSPITELASGASYALDTNWLPTRVGKNLHTVTPAAVIERPLAATGINEGAQLSGIFGVFFPGKLVAHVFDTRGTEISTLDLMPVDPLAAVELNDRLPMPEHAVSVAVHLVDGSGVDRGELGHVFTRK